MPSTAPLKTLIAGINIIIAKDIDPWERRKSPRTGMWSRSANKLLNFTQDAAANRLRLGVRAHYCEAQFATNALNAG